MSESQGDRSEQMGPWITELEACFRKAHAQEETVLPLQTVQMLFVHLMREYVLHRRHLAEHSQDGDVIPFPDDHRVTATEVAIVANDMIRAVGMDSFELNMWRALGRL